MAMTWPSPKGALSGGIRNISPPRTDCVSNTIPTPIGLSDSVGLDALEHRLHHRADRAHLVGEGGQLDHDRSGRKGRHQDLTATLCLPTIAAAPGPSSTLPEPNRTAISPQRF